MFRLSNSRYFTQHNITNLDVWVANVIVSLFMSILVLLYCLICLKQMKMNNVGL